MKKLLLVLIICLTILFGCCGCSSNNYDEQGRQMWTLDGNTTLVCVIDEYPYRILVHKETGVMYLENYATHMGGITVMLDEDGNPMIWEREL